MIGNDLIKSAILGTDMFFPDQIANLGPIDPKIMSLPTDKEDKLLKLAITAFLYEEAGRKPAVIEGVIPEGPEEELPLINDNLNSKIKASVSMKDEVLLHYFIFLINKANQVATAELVPILLNKALENRKKAKALVKACGATGKWLCKLNPSWQLLLDKVEDGEVWKSVKLF